MKNLDAMSVAAVLAAARPDRKQSAEFVLWHQLVTALGNLLARDNPKFDRTRFYQATEN